MTIQLLIVAHETLAQIKLASSKRNWAETKRILKQLPLGPHCRVSLTETETSFT